MTNYRYAKILLFCLPLFVGCSQSNKLSKTNTSAVASIPNYQQLANWAAHPAKNSLSDSTPRPYMPNIKDTSVAVFFIHPTTFTNKDWIENQPYTSQFWNAKIENTELNDKTDKSSILYQASVFNQYLIYAPRYRQAHLQSFYIQDSIAQPFFDTAYADVKNAFQYFLATLTPNKPFVIAAHSQGTLHAGRLIKELIENKPLQNRLVAAYLIGLSVPLHYFENIPPCTQPNSTGCFVSWRTFKKGYTPAWAQNEKNAAVVINPISWTMDTLAIPRSKHLGSVLFKFNKPKAGSVSAQIHGNILWSSKPRFFGNLFYTSKNYHVGDINLFWKDIRNNLAVRVQAFSKK